MTQIDETQVAQAPTDTALNATQLAYKLIDLHLEEIELAIERAETRFAAKFPGESAHDLQLRKHKPVDRALQMAVIKFSGNSHF